MNKPSNWDNVSAGNGGNVVYKLPAGGYVCQIKEVTDDTAKQALEVKLEVVEGEMKGFGMNLQEQAGRYPFELIPRVYYSGENEWSLKKFKGLITSVEETNKDFKFDWDNPKCLVGKGVGIVVGERESVSNKDGKVYTNPFVSYFASADRIRKGNFNVPALKKLPEGTVTTSAVAETFPELVDDGDLPF